MSREVPRLIDCNMGIGSRKVIDMKTQRRGVAVGVLIGETNGRVDEKSRKMHGIRRRIEAILVAHFQR